MKMQTALLSVEQARLEQRVSHRGQSKTEQQSLMQSDGLTRFRFLASATISAILTFIEMVGQMGNGWWWILVVLAINTAAIFVLVWLIGEISIAVITFVEEWYEVFRPGETSLKRRENKESSSDLNQPGLLLPLRGRKKGDPTPSTRY